MANEAKDPGPASEGRRWEERFNNAGTRVEEELRRVVRYIDEEVVPEIRRNSSSALRLASAELERLALTMENRHDEGSGPKS